MNETAQSEESAADESVTQATLGKVAEESRAIAAEAEITAIEEGGRQSVGGGISNPSDRRLPLIARIYGIVMIVEAVSDLLGIHRLSKFVKDNVTITYGE